MRFIRISYAELPGSHSWDNYIVLINTITAHKRMGYCLSLSEVERLHQGISKIEAGYPAWVQSTHDE